MVDWTYAQWFAILLGVPMLMAFFVLFPKKVATRVRGEDRKQRTSILRGELRAWSPDHELVIRQSEWAEIDAAEVRDRVAAYVAGDVDDGPSRRERLASGVRSTAAGVRQGATLPGKSLAQRLALEAVAVAVLGFLALASVPVASGGIGPVLPAAEQAASTALSLATSLPGLGLISALLLTTVLSSASAIYQTWFGLAALLATGALTLWELDRRIEARSGPDWQKRRYDDPSDIRLLPSRRRTAGRIAAVCLGSYTLGALMYWGASYFVGQDLAGLSGVAFGTIALITLVNLQMYGFIKHLRTVRSGVKHPASGLLLARAVIRTVFIAIGVLTIPVLLGYALQLIADGALTGAVNAVLTAPEWVQVGLLALLGIGIALGLYQARARLIEAARAGTSSAATGAILRIDWTRAAIKSAPVGFVIASGALGGIFIGPVGAVGAALGVWIVLRIGGSLYQRAKGRTAAYQRRDDPGTPFVTVRVSERPIRTADGGERHVVSVSGTTLLNDDQARLVRDATRTAVSLLEDGSTPPTESEYWAERAAEGIEDRETIKSELSEFTRTEWKAALQEDSDVEQVQQRLLDQYPPEYVAHVWDWLDKTSQAERIGGTYRSLD